ncbi:hypothetical protein CY35_08G082400 [Sphagnum magellanicum]|nr:hypothetical protein CY35_08G082400 [Sphagnum magellanicum]
MSPSLPPLASLHRQSCQAGCCPDMVSVILLQALQKANLQDSV